LPQRSAPLRPEQPEAQPTRRGRVKAPSGTAAHDPVSMHAKVRERIASRHSDRRGPGTQQDQSDQERAQDFEQRSRDVDEEHGHSGSTEAGDCSGGAPAAAPDRCRSANENGAETAPVVDGFRQRYGRLRSGTARPRRIQRGLGTRSGRRRRRSRRSGGSRWLGRCRLRRDAAFTACTTWPWRPLFSPSSRPS